MFKREVYRNLHFRKDVVYSVCKDGLVEGHALCHVMDGVTFSVGPKGNHKFAAQQLAEIEMCGVPVSRNTNYDQDDPRAWEPMYKWVEVKYNPYKFKTFVAVDGDKLTPIFNARKVVIYSEDNKSKVMAMIPIEKSDKN